MPIFCHLGTAWAHSIRKQIWEKYTNAYFWALGYVELKPGDMAGGAGKGNDQLNPDLVVYKNRPLFPIHLVQYTFQEFSNSFCLPGGRAEFTGRDSVKGFCSILPIIQF